MQEADCIPIDVEITMTYRSTVCRRPSTCTSPNCIALSFCDINSTSSIVHYVRNTGRMNRQHHASRLAIYANCPPKQSCTSCGFNFHTDLYFQNASSTLYLSSTALGASEIRIHPMARTIGATLLSSWLTLSVASISDQTERTSVSSHLVSWRTSSRSHALMSCRRV